MHLDKALGYGYMHWSLLIAQTYANDPDLCITQPVNFFLRSKRPMKVTLLSRVRLFGTPWTLAY